MKLTVNRFGKRVNILSASIFLKSQRIHVFRCQEDFSEVNSQIFEWWTHTGILMNSGKTGN